MFKIDRTSKLVTNHLCHCLVTVVLSLLRRIYPRCRSCICTDGQLSSSCKAVL